MRGAPTDDDATRPQTSRSANGVYYVPDSPLFSSKGLRAVGRAERYAGLDGAGHLEGVSVSGLTDGGGDVGSAGGRRGTRIADCPVASKAHAL